MGHRSKISETIIPRAWLVFFSLRGKVSIEAQRIYCDDLSFGKRCRAHYLELQVWTISNALFALLFIFLQNPIMVSLIHKLWTGHDSWNHAWPLLEALVCSIYVKTLGDLVGTLIHHRGVGIWVLICAHVHWGVGVLLSLGCYFIAELIHIELALIYGILWIHCLLIQIYWYWLNILALNWWIWVVSGGSELLSPRSMTCWI